EALMNQLKMNDMGEIGTFLGVEFKDAKEGKALAMSQRAYIEKLTRQFKVDLAGHVSKLSQLDTIDLTQDPVADRLKESGAYRSIIGGLLYVANMTRPDISTAVSVLSRLLDKPTDRAMKYAKQILKYLHTTKDKCL